MSAELRPCSRCNGSGSEPAGDVVGMCGDSSPPWRNGDETITEWCVLPAGHLGWHRGPNVLSEDGHAIPPMQWGFAADLAVGDTEETE